MRIRLSFTLLALVSGAALADSPASRADTLYARLGGQENVTAFVDATIARASLDLDQRALVRDQWIARICAISGGGCRAAGDVTRDAPVSLIEALRGAMRAQDVPLSARNELLDLLTRR